MFVNRKRTPEREDKKKYDDSPPRKIREKPRSWDNDKEKRFEGPQMERSPLERDRFSSSRSQEDVEKKYDSSYNRHTSHSSKSSFTNSKSDGKDHDSKSSQEKYRDLNRSRSRDERSGYHDSSKRSRDDEYSSRHSRDHNETRSVTTKAPIRRLVDY